MQKKLLTIILWLCSWQTWASESMCRVTHFDEFAGMAQWHVTQIVQDHNGMMWFSTWNGLNRYDGYQFECFKSQVGNGINMPSDRIQDMMLNDQGNLVCLIEGNVLLFDVKTCQYHEMSREEVAKWKSTFDVRREITLRDINKPYHYTDRYGKQWNIPDDIGIGGNPHYCTTDKQGNVWLRSNYGAYRLTFDKRPYTYFPQEKPAQIRCFLIDRKQRYWVTSKDDATVRLYDKDNNLMGYLGRDGHMHRQYTSFGSPIYCLFQDSKGVFWLGSKPDGLFRAKENADGSFAIESFRHSPTDPNTLSCNDIYYIAEDAKGRLWLATFDGGINCIEHPWNDRLQFLHSENGLQLPKETCKRVRQILITKNHVLLAATTTGLLVGDVGMDDVRKAKWTSHTREKQRSTCLSNNATMFVMQDLKGRIFVCTESGGVNEITSHDLLSKQLEFKHHNMMTGLPSDVALSAYPYQDGIAVVSNNQVIFFNPDKPNREGLISLFWKDKLRFSDARPVQLPDKRWLFGLQDGAFTISAEDIKPNPYVPPISLTGLSIENGVIDRAAAQYDTLTLMPPSRNIIVYFAALDYTDSKDINYAFKISEKTDEWNSIGKNRSINLLDLRPGTYHLQIRSTNSDGIWMDNARTLTIIVKPTFWETGWARLLLALFILLIGYGIYRTYRHIMLLNKKQHDTYEAYLALLNAQPRNEEMVPETGHSGEKAPLPHREENATGDSTPKLKAEDDAFMQRAVRFIEEHISDPDINIGDMAEATATSRSGLNRKMKSLLGMTPLDFIRGARIRKACGMLEEGMSVNDVAYGCGFSDPKYFGKCFKAETGKTPTEYKAEYASKR